jgi:hypothetical protein
MPNKIMGRQDILNPARIMGRQDILNPARIMGRQDILNPQQSYSPAQLDAMARQAGFQNYAQWQAYRHQQMMQQQQRQMQSAQPAPPPQPEPTNWLQRLMGDWYPLASPAQKARKAMQGRRQ